MNESIRPSPFDVIASLDKRLREYKHVGWVYILRNPAFREPLFKIGKSRRPPPLRADELAAATAVPEGFQVVYFVHVSNHHEAESQVHSWLASHRKTLGKEFFNVPLSRAVEMLNRVAEMYPVVVGRGRNSWVLPQFFHAVTVKCPSCGLDNRVHQLAVSVRVKCRGCAEGLPSSEG
jgi:T5orf172 domain-containing protein